LKTKKNYPNQISARAGDLHRPPESCNVSATMSV